MKAILTTNQSIDTVMKKLNSAISVREIANKHENSDRLFCWERINPMHRIWIVRGRVKAVEPYKTTIQLKLSLTNYVYISLVIFILYEAFCIYKCFVVAGVFAVFIEILNIIEGYRYKKHTVKNIRKIVDEVN